MIAPTPPAFLAKMSVIRSALPSSRRCGGGNTGTRDRHLRETMNSNSSLDTNVMNCPSWTCGATVERGQTHRFQS